jgi:hypothetical protein
MKRVCMYEKCLYVWKGLIKNSFMTELYILEYFFKDRVVVLEMNYNRVAVLEQF